MSKNSLPTISVDFDGVIHDYSNGWEGAGVVGGGPVPGACAWLVEATKHFEVCIYSSRSAVVRGMAAMREAVFRWLHESEEIPEVFRRDEAQRTYCALRWPMSKPAAVLTIDDRAFHFQGTFPTVAEIQSFRPWNKPAQ